MILYLGQPIKIVDSGVSASVGTKLWNDKNYKISSLPSILEGLTIALLPYEIESDTNVVIDIDQASIIYLAIHTDSNSENTTDWLENNNWKKLEERAVIYNGENGSEALEQIWFNEYLETTNLNTTFSSEPLTIAMFIKPGKNEYNSSSHFTLTNCISINSCIFTLCYNIEKCVVEGYTIQDYPGQIRMGYSTFKEAKFECSTGII